MPTSRFERTIFERACFNQRKQESGESAELCITTIHQMVDRCEYGEIKEELIGDRLVVGIADKALSERMQMEAGLTLEKAKMLIRQQEAVKEQGQILASRNNPQLDAVKPQKPKKKASNHLPKRENDTTRNADDVGESHPVQQCPTKNEICHRCNHKRHSAKQCLSKTVAMVAYHEETSESVSTGEPDEFYLSAANLNAVGEDMNAWKIELNVADQPLPFKIDTGAEVTAISESTWKSLRNPPTLTKTTKHLCGPDRKPLQMVGEADINLKSKQKCSIQRVFVVKGLSNNLLGLPTIKALNLLQYVDSVQNDIFKEYSDLFTGLHTFTGEYTICLKLDAVPHAIHTPRKVPLPLKEAVEKELGRVEELGLISKVSEPTEWCASMVVVPKASGKVHIIYYVLI